MEVEKGARQEMTRETKLELQDKNKGLASTWSGRRRGSLDRMSFAERSVLIVKLDERALLSTRLPEEARDRKITTVVYDEKLERMKHCIAREAHEVREVEETRQKIRRAEKAQAAEGRIQLQWKGQQGSEAQRKFKKAPPLRKPMND